MLFLICLMCFFFDDAFLLEYACATSGAFN